MDHMAEVRGSSSTTVQNGPFSTPLLVPPSFIIIFRHLDRPDDADASNGDIIIMWAKLDALPPPSISGVMWGYTDDDLRSLMRMVSKLDAIDGATRGLRGIIIGGIIIVPDNDDDGRSPAHQHTASSRVGIRRSRRPRSSEEEGERAAPLVAAVVVVVSIDDGALIIISGVDTADDNNGGDNADDDNTEADGRSASVAVVINITGDDEAADANNNDGRTKSVRHGLYGSMK